MDDKEQAAIDALRAAGLEAEACAVEALRARHTTMMDAYHAGQRDSYKNGQAAERARWADAVRAVMCSDVGVQTRHKLEAGQGVNTLDGQAWLSALRLLAEGPNVRSQPGQTA